MSAPPDYAELHCLSCFSFQRGASMPQELFARAKQQRYRALAITDECTLAGIVRAKQAAAEHRLRLIVGNEMQLADGPRIVLLVENRTGYANLCRLITRARRRAAKGEYQLLRSDFDGHTDGLLALWLPARKPDVEQAHWLQSQFPQRCWLAVELHRGADDAARLQALLSLAHALQLPAVASGDVHMHVRKRRALQDTMTAIRLRTTLAQAGHALFPNGERHLRTRATLAALYPAQLLSETVRIAERCTFSLDELEYQYPHEIVPAGQTATTYLRQLVEDGIAQRWPEGFRDAAEARYVRGLIEKELELIADMKYEAYFLTVYDIVRFARSQAILCQGRGSAANSVVCYLLGITELRPGMTAMLFERFISKNRNEPPDIDVDFEHERREEVLQYVFNRYGRDRAALVAVVIQYRGRSAVRDVAGALGMPRDQIDELAHTMDRWSGDAPIPDYLRERGFDPDAPLMQRVIVLTGLLVGFPRHLSQHPGGFVISEQPLSTLVPVENAAMDGRTVVQWDKDDIDEVKMQKVDCLALGMLTCVRKTFQMLHASGRRPHFKAQDIPPDDASTFGMIQRADTVGVFQIESRAQMAMLPRLRPKTFYDLVVQIAIVRPGPIQGDMVHPYLRRRTGEEPESYPSDALKDVLSRTLGVPLFQEQVMQIAMVAANYSAEDADNLRRSMAAWKRRGGLDPHREKLLAGMLANGYPPEFAERIFEQIKGFGSYGFPESHAASFALIAWQSSWLKCHEPAAFAAALINSQPMGFYSPSQIVQDARRHGIEVRPVDVRYSDWDCTLESAASMPAGVGRPAKWRASGNAAGRLQRRAVNNETSAPISSTAHGGSFDDDMLVAIPAAQPALRLGLRLIDGLREGTARRIEAARTQRAFADLDELCRRAMLDARDRALLADAGALRGLVGHRHKARWAVAGVEAQRPLFDDVAATDEAPVALPLPSTEQDMRTDYATLGLTLGRHPLSLLRAVLRRRRFRRSQELLAMPHGRKVAFAGLVTLRQRPQTASGVTFLTLEDEDGLVNVVVWKHIAQQQRHELLQSRLLAVHGRLESQDGTRHLIADRLENLNELLGELDTSSRDFH